MLIYLKKHSHLNSAPYEEIQLLSCPTYAKNDLKVFKLIYYINILLKYIKGLYRRLNNEYNNEDSATLVLNNKYISISNRTAL